MPKVAGVGAAERRRRQLDQVNDAIATHTIISGEITVVGGGDVAADINFPVWFVEKPIMTFGGEVAGTVDLTLGSFPLVSALVGKWDIQSLDAVQGGKFSGRMFYAGAQMLLSIDGASDIIVHYQFSGMALTNPNGTVSSFNVDSVI